MRPNPVHHSTDPEVVRRLIREHPWGTIVSVGPAGLVASHYPILLEEESPQLAVLTHLGRPDEQLHGIGGCELLLIVQGEHGYISPSWYEPGGTRAPTWNFSVAHCYGVPEVLDRERNLAVLARLVERFERHVEQPMLLDAEYAERLVDGTVGIRLSIERFVCKLKLSQDKDPVSRRNVIGALRRAGPYRQPALADEMERAEDG